MVQASLTAAETRAALEPEHEARARAKSERQGCEECRALPEDSMGCDPCLARKGWAPSPKKKEVQQG